jgi:hypothetical protein
MSHTSPSPLRGERNQRARTSSTGSATQGEPSPNPWLQSTAPSGRPAAEDDRHWVEGMITGYNPPPLRGAQQRRPAPYSTLSLPGGDKRIHSRLQSLTSWCGRRTRELRNERNRLCTAVVQTAWSPPLHPRTGGGNEGDPSSHERAANTAGPAPLSATPIHRTGQTEGTNRIETIRGRSRVPSAAPAPSPAAPPAAPQGVGTPARPDPPPAAPAPGSGTPPTPPPPPTRR